MDNDMQLKIKLLREGSTPPCRATEGSAGYDLHACLTAPVVIQPGQTVKVPTGIAMQLLPGTVGLIFARSSVAVKHGVLPANAVGVIDSDYRGEVIVGLYNQSGVAYEIGVDERIAQLVIVPVFTPEVMVCSQLDDTTRGAGGFGSTGKA